jgi:hypothetical protein
MNSEQPSTNDAPVARGPGLGCALAGFGLLVAAQLLPWASARTNPLLQDFPTASGGKVEIGLSQSQVPHEIFDLGWLVVLGAVATALAVRPSARRVVVAAGLGLVAAQLALLIGITYAIKHPPGGGFVSGALALRSLTPQRFEAGLYCAYLALALFAAALLFAGGVPRRLLFAGGVPRRLRRPDAPPGPADLTVTAVPAADPTAWSQRPADINVGDRRPER